MASSGHLNSPRHNSKGTNNEEKEEKRVGSRRNSVSSLNAYIHSDGNHSTRRRYSTQSARVSRSETNLAKLAASPKPQHLARRNTYVIDNVDEDDSNNNTNSSKSSSNGDLLSSTLHTGGIKALLDKANSGNSFVFPPEVRAYISSHFRMIREENSQLRQNLADSTAQVNEVNAMREQCRGHVREIKELGSQLKVISGQLDREKAKNKAMIRRIKDTDQNNHVVWFDASSQQQQRPMSAAKEQQPPTMSRPATTMFGSARDPSERKISVLTRKTKSLKQDLAMVHGEMELMKQVLVREIGSEEQVDLVLSGHNTGWTGRAEKVASLEATVSSLQALLADQRANNHSDRMFDSRVSSPVMENNLTAPPRGSGDGSSRQGSLSRQDSKSPAAPLVLTGEESKVLKDLTLKYKECKTICQVSDVERERLGEHVRVISKKLKHAEEKCLSAEIAVRVERRQTAKLQRLLEKARVELRDVSATSSEDVAHVTNVNVNTRNEDNAFLKEELDATKTQLKEVVQQREEDLEMFLKMAADSRRMFTQSLKQES